MKKKQISRVLNSDVPNLENCFSYVLETMPVFLAELLDLLDERYV